MFSRYLFDYWRGFVVVTLNGQNVSDVLNMATTEGIMLWEVRQTRPGAYRLRMHREDVRRLRPILRRTRSKIRFERKYGVPFLIWRA